MRGYLLILVCLLNIAGVNPSGLYASEKTLGGLPVTYYPGHKLELSGSALANYVNENGRAEDAVAHFYWSRIMSRAVLDFSLKQSSIWLHLQNEGDLEKARKSVYGKSRAVVFFPRTILDAGESKAAIPRAQKLLKDAAAKRNLIYVCGVHEDHIVDLPPVRELAAHADIMSFYLPKGMMRGPKEFNDIVSRLVKECREGNQSVKIELVFPLGETEAARRYTVSLLEAVLPQIDRVGIFCVASPEGTAQVAALMSLLRSA